MTKVISLESVRRIRELREARDRVVSEYNDLLTELNLPLALAEEDPRVQDVCERATDIMDELDSLLGLGPS